MIDKNRIWKQNSCLLYPGLQAQLRRDLYDRKGPCRTGGTQSPCGWESRHLCWIPVPWQKACRQEMPPGHPPDQQTTSGSLYRCNGLLRTAQAGRGFHIEGVDLVLGAEQKLDILMYLDDLKKKKKAVQWSPHKRKIYAFSPSCSADDRTRHFLKVQDGLTTSVLTVIIPLPVDEAATVPSPVWWNRHRR